MDASTTLTLDTPVSVGDNAVTEANYSLYVAPLGTQGTDGAAQAFKVSVDALG